MTGDDVEAIEQQAQPEGTMRRAHPAEADRLSALACRSKAYWGYNDDFMEACRADLTLSVDDLLSELVYVLDVQGKLMGFYRLRPQGITVMLSDLFVEPQAIGCGYGKQL